MNTKQENWHERWDAGRTGWHEADVNKFLAEHADKMFNGKSGQKVLVPFAGKSYDVLWLAQQGHSVIAVELVEKPILEFISEHKLEATKVEVACDGGGKVTCYKMMEDRIHFFNCSVFDLPRSLCGSVDCVYDRGALVAVFPPEREKYALLVLSLLSPNARYLLVTVDYPVEEYQKGPRSVPDDVVHSLFGGSLQIKQLESVEMLELAKERFGVKSYFYEKVFIMAKE